MSGLVVAIEAGSVNQLLKGSYQRGDLRGVWGVSSDSESAEELVED